MVWGALKALNVVDRESFTLATFDRETGQPTGRVSAREVAAEVLRWLDVCSSHGVTECPECTPDGNDEQK
jgi:hypothetical protein